MLSCSGVGAPRAWSPSGAADSAPPLPTEPGERPKAEPTEPHVLPDSLQVQLLLNLRAQRGYLRTTSTLSCLSSRTEPPPVHISRHPGAFRACQGQGPGWQEAADSRGALLAPSSCSGHTTAPWRCGKGMQKGKHQTLLSPEQPPNESLL